MRFASLRSSSPQVRARLQAALFTNRKRNKARRETQEEAGGDVWAVGSVTVGDDSANSGYGYNSYESVGSIDFPIVEFPITYFAMSLGGETLYIEFDGKVDTILSGASITIKGQTYSLGSISWNGSSTTVNTIVEAELISASDIGQTIPFTITLG